MIIPSSAILQQELPAEGLCPGGNDEYLEKIVKDYLGKGLQTL
jgi:hypothetical protein